MRYMANSQSNITNNANLAIGVGQGAAPVTAPGPVAETAAAPAWYAVSVIPGTELQAAETLRAQLAVSASSLQAECFAPLYRTQRKVAGEYVEEDLPLIPGCICVVCELAADATAAAAVAAIGITAELDAIDDSAAPAAMTAPASPANPVIPQALRSAVRKSGVGTSARFAVEPLHEVVVEWLQACTVPGNRVVDASAGVAEDGAVHVTAGPLAHKEQWIRKVNHRKKCAYLDIPAGARSIQAQSGLRLARA